MKLAASSGTRKIPPGLWRGLSGRGVETRLDAPLESMACRRHRERELPKKSSKMKYFYVLRSQTGRI